MIVPRLDKVLAKKKRTFYWLAKETGVSHTTLWRLKKGKAVGKPRRKAAKPMVCIGAAPFDFTEAMRDARLELTVGQLMNMENM